MHVIIYLLSKDDEYVSCSRQFAVKVFIGRAFASYRYCCTRSRDIPQVLHQNNSECIIVLLTNTQPSSRLRSCFPFPVFPAYDQHPPSLIMLTYCACVVRGMNFTQVYLLNSAIASVILAFSAVAEIS